jgi:ubiquinone/menaquinone biosynthesis C-methylase UbiE
VGAAVRAAYEEQYSPEIREWRDLGAKYKARNVRAVCAGMRFAKVLEIGAGDGAILGHLDAWPAKERCYAVEISGSGVERIRERGLASLVEARAFDGYRVPYPDGFFDLAILSHVLEHVEFPRALLREMGRVSAHQVIEVPCEYAPRADERVREFLAYGHIDLYSPTLLRFLLKSEGFEILRDHLSRVTLDVREYSVFRNRGRPRTRSAVAMLRLRHRLGDLRFRLAGRDSREALASAYTALCRAPGGPPRGPEVLA